MIRRLVVTILAACAAASLLVASLATTASAATKVVPLSAGAFHTCALTPSGGAMCWGSGGDGTLGIGAPPGGFPSDSNVPIAVNGLGSGVAAIAAGSYHTCALTTGVRRSAGATTRGDSLATTRRRRAI